MPVMDGLTSTREIRRIEKEFSARLDFVERETFRPALIIALTGVGSTGVQEEAFSCGVDIFMLKPVRFSELMTVLGSRTNRN